MLTIKSYNIINVNENYKVYVNGKFIGNAKDIPEAERKIRDAEKEKTTK